MKRLTSILAISVIAVMSAGAARADIASTTYVDNKVSPVSTKANNNATAITALQSDKQDKSAMVDSTSKSLNETNDTNYPTVAAVYTIATNALGTQVNNKLDKKFTGDANKSKAVITDANGAITTGTISSAMITDSTIVNADIAPNAAIATSKISGLDTTLANKQAKLSDTQLNAVNSGITAAKVTTYDGYDATIKANTSAAAAAKSAADAAQATANAKEASANKTNTYDAAATDKNTKFPTISAAEAIADAKVAGANTDIAKLKEDVAANKTAIAGKQATLSAAQLAAANSGITAAKVTTYDGYDATIKANTSAAAAAKSAADAAQATANKAVVANAAITAGTGTKITYDAKGLVTGSTSLAASDIPTLATSKISGLDTTLANKQAKLNDTQLNAVNSGITSAKVTTYEGYSAKITTAQNTANTAKTTAEAAIAAPAATTISTDGLYTLTMKVVDGTRTYAWEKIGR